MEMNENKKINIYTKFHLVKILFVFTDTKNAPFQTQQHTTLTSGHNQNKPSSQKYLKTFVILSTNFGNVRVTVISVTQADFSANLISLMAVLQHPNYEEAYSVVHFPTSLNFTVIYIYNITYIYIIYTIFFSPTLTFNYINSQQSAKFCYYCQRVM